MHDVAARIKLEPYRYSTIDDDRKTNLSARVRPRYVAIAMTMMMMIMMIIIIPLDSALRLR
jgi:hypothetical protein